MGNDNMGWFNQRTLDAMAFIGFLIGIANYEENLDQTKAQDMLNNVLKEVHGHLKEQDDKIDCILELLEGGEVDVKQRTNEGNVMY